MGAGDWEIIIDAVMVTDRSVNSKETSNYKAYQMLVRYLELNAYMKNME
jgi:hypothetical protein